MKKTRPGNHEKMRVNDSQEASTVGGERPAPLALVVGGEAVASLVRNAIPANLGIRILAVEKIEANAVFLREAPLLIVLTGVALSEEESALLAAQNNAGWETPIFSVGASSAPISVPGSLGHYALPAQNAQLATQGAFCRRHYRRYSPFSAAAVRLLEHDRENFLHLFRQTPDLVCILRGPDHVFEFVNEAHVRTLGFDATGLAVREAQPESVEVHGLLDDVYRTGETAKLHEIPVTLGRALRYFNLTYAPRYDSEQRVSGVMILGVEVSEQVRAREELRASERRLEQNLLEMATLLNVAPIYIGFLDRGGNFLNVNELALRAQGLPREELQGRAIWDTPAWAPLPESAARLREAVRRAAEGESSEFDLQYRHATLRPGGEIRWVTLRTVPVYDANGVVWRLVTTGADITDRKNSELKLAESQASLRIALASAKMGTWSIDLPTAAAQLSPEARTILGLENDNMTVDYALSELIHPAHREEVARLLDEAVAERKLYQAEFRIVLAEGALRWILSRGQARYSKEGAPLTLSGVLMDITDRKRSEAVLLESQQRLERATTAVGVGVWEVDATTRKTWRSPTYDAVYGLDYEEDRSLDFFFAKIDPRDRDRVRQEYALTLLDGQPLNTSYRVQWPDGTEHWSRVTGRAERDASGMITRLSGTNIDVTENRRRQEQLARLAEASLHLNSQAGPEEKFRLLVDAAREIVGVHQAVASFVEQGSWKPTLTVASLSERYSAWREFRGLDDARGLHALVCEERRPMRFTQSELERYPAWRELAGDHEHHPPLRGWLAVPLLDSAHRCLGLIQLSDKYDGDFTPADEALLVQLAQIAATAIEKDQLLRSERAAVKARDEFISIASHELKTPLTALRLQNQMLHRQLERGEPGPEREQRFLRATEISSRQLDKLGRLVGDMLEASRIGLGQLNLVPTDFDLSELTAEVFERFREAFAAQGMAATLETEPLRLYADPVRIDQVITNLLSNALKYGADRPVALRLSTEGAFARLTVEDQGLGIAPEHQGRIFERFERAMSFRNISGLGLGLYITRQIVEAHGGRIEVASELGHGARFTVRLPFSGPLSGPPAAAEETSG